MPSKSTLILARDLRFDTHDKKIIFLDRSWMRMMPNPEQKIKFDYIEVISESLDVSEILRRSRSLEKTLLKELSETLNSYHKESLSTRAWQIMLGHWVRIYTQMVTKCVVAIESALENHEITEALVGEFNNDFPTPENTAETVSIFEENSALEFVCGHVLREIWGDKNAARISKSNCKVEVKPNSSLTYQPSIIEKVIDKLKVILSNLAPLFVREKDALIVSSYLPLRFEIILNFALHQWPRVTTHNRNYAIATLEQNTELRKRLLKSSSLGSIEYRIATGLLAIFLPKCFLENFPQVKDEIMDRSFPKSPKYIFTSNSFMTDEVFKQYTARKVDHGIKYFVGQHGNNYGTLRDVNPTIEEETSDKFFSWGWSSEKAKPGFLIKNPNPRGRRKSEKLSRLLLILGHRNFEFSIHDVEAELIKNVQHQVDFTSSLQTHIRNSLTLRFHPQTLNTGEKNILDCIPAGDVASVNFGNSNIDRLIRDSKIVIHSYDSTGILETLSKNVPTLAFWDFDSSPKTKTAQPFYDLLERAGIIHQSGKSAGMLLNEIWEDIDVWWMSKDVQDARKIFCANYARSTVRPIRELKSFLSS